MAKSKKRSTRPTPRELIGMTIGDNAESPAQFFRELHEAWVALPAEHRGSIFVMLQRDISQQTTVIEQWDGLNVGSDIDAHMGRRKALLGASLIASQMLAVLVHVGISPKAEVSP